MWNKPGKPLPPRVYREIPVDIGFRMRKEVGKDVCPVCQFQLSEGRPDLEPPVTEDVNPAVILLSSTICTSKFGVFQKATRAHTRHSFSLQTHLRPQLSADSSRTYHLELTTAVLLYRSIPVRLGGPDKHESARPSLGKLNQLPMLMNVNKT